MTSEIGTATGAGAAHGAARRGAGHPEHPTPGLRAFVTGRIASANGVAAALYLGLSIWVLLHPHKAARIWRRLNGR